MSAPDFTHDILITFGDCDPAGIVFYPNYFRFLDRTFHAWLMTHGGHKAVCAKAGARDIGLVPAHFSEVFKLMRARTDDPLVLAAASPLR